MDNIIEVKNLSFEYSDEQSHTVLENFDLGIKRGSFTVILGHNGSGKSTLAKLFNGLYKPKSGTVCVDSLLTTDEKNELEIKRRIGLVFQNPDNQIISSIVEEDVAFGPENLGFSPEETRERVDDALKKVNMYKYRNSSPYNLSGGQKQRIAIAGILAMTPECIVLDEPTAMLDPKGRKEVIDAIIDLNHNHGITIVLITHFMEEAEKADRVLVMSNGKLVGDGTPGEMFSQVELMREAGLSVPQTTQLLEILREQGVETTKGVISVDACVDELLKHLN